MLKSRRGLLAAGLAVAVAGAVGVVSTLDAGAEQIPGSSAGAPSHVAQVADGAAAAPAISSSTGVKSTPPALLPWGERPRPIKKGRPGASAKSLRGTDFDAAPADTSGATKPRPRYGPKGLAGLDDSRQPVPPLPPMSVADPEANTVFQYAKGWQLFATDTLYANITIAKPTLGAGDDHTLAELAVQTEDGSQAVEIGWTVDRSINGDDDPHLFVYHWVNGEKMCYNGCGFVQYSSNIKPGDTLKDQVSKRFGIQYAGGAWWLAFESEWVGYFPEALWNRKGVKFNRSELVQVFAEVASPTVKTCDTQMGVPNQLPSAENSDAAKMASVVFSKSTDVNLIVQSTIRLPGDRKEWGRNYYVWSPTVADNNTKIRSFRYGGPNKDDPKSDCYVPKS